MKILFIYPNENSQIGFNYGLAYISAVLKKAGHQTDLWQLCEEIEPLPTKHEFIRRLQKAGPDLIGFSVVTNQWSYAAKLAQWAKQAVSVPLICGGVHATAAGTEIMESDLFDYIMRGESEEAFLEFVNVLDQGAEVNAINNLGLKINGVIKLNPLQPLPCLRTLPFKDYALFDFQKIIDAKNGWVGLMASRGCPFACTYCFNHQMVEHYRKDLKCSFKELNYIRHHDVGQVISEIQYLLKNFRNIKMFIFDDDLFTFYREYVLEFCKAYAQVSELPFVVNAHVGFFDQERAQALAQAGCRIVKFGVESGSPRIRKQILARHTKNEKIIQAIRVADNFGLHTSIFLMLALPGESEDDLMQTIKLTAKAKPGRFRWSFFYPFPNTRAYTLAAEKDCINQKLMTNMENFTDGSCLDFGPAQNLLLKKIGRAMPWFVNACSDFQTADFYQQKVNQILELDTRDWEKRAPHIEKEDHEISKEFVSKGLSHYAIKYNRFMGVISDYFTEDKG